LGGTSLKKKIIAILFLCLLFGVGLLVYNGQRNLQMKELYYSGTIEAKQAELGFQVSGRIVEVLADEGQFVRRDQLLAYLEESEYKARHEQAQARLENAKKNVQRLELVLELYKTTLPNEVQRAEAGVAVLSSQLRELEAGYRGQEIEQGKLAFLTAKDVMEEAKRNKERYDNLVAKQLVSESEWERVKLKYETALKEFEKAKETFDMLLEGIRKETIQTARARLAEGKAVLRQAKNNLKKIEAAEKDVEAAASQVKVAKSSLKMAEIQLRYTQLRAPFDGIISSRNVETGEVVLPGREVISLSDLSSVELKIFIGETKIGKVKPGQLVDVKVDTFPDKTYKGTVSFISPEAEFTPKMIQTQKERVKLVYLVKVCIPNPHLELKPGMPADAWLR
jgi:HlyD family secretion protein